MPSEWATANRRGTDGRERKRGSPLEWEQRGVSLWGGGAWLTPNLPWLTTIQKNQVWWCLCSCISMDYEHWALSDTKVNLGGSSFCMTSYYVELLSTQPLTYASPLSLSGSNSTQHPRTLFPVTIWLWLPGAGLENSHSVWLHVCWVHGEMRKPQDITKIILFLGCPSLSGIKISFIK